MRDYYSFYKQIIAMHKGLRASAEELAESKPFLWVGLKSPIWLGLYSLDDFKSLQATGKETPPATMIGKMLTPMGLIKIEGRYNSQIQATIILNEKTSIAISMGLSLWLGCSGEDPSDSDLVKALATFLVGDFAKRGSDTKKIEGAINASNFNAFAEIESLVYFVPPLAGETFKEYLKRCIIDLTSFEKEAKERGTYAKDFLERVKTSPQEVLSKYKELAEEAKQDARTLEVIYTKLDYTALYFGSIENQSAIADIKNDIRDISEDLRSGDKEAIEMESVFNELNEIGKIEPKMYFPSNNAIVALDRLFTNFVPEKDPEKIAKALEWKAKLESKKPTLAKLKGELKDLKAKVDAIKGEPFPDDDELAEVETKKKAKEAEIDAFKADLEEGGRNILVRNGKVYRNGNNVETHYNDMGEIEETYKGGAFTTTITKGEAWAERESTGKKDLAREIQSEVFRKCKKGQSLSGYFTNAEIYEVVLGASQVKALLDGSPNGKQQLANAKQMFWDYIEVLAHTFINSTKVVINSEVSKRRGKKDSEIITGTLLTCVYGREGISFILNEALFKWAIFGETSYIVASEDAIRKLDTPRSKGAYRSLLQQETMDRLRHGTGNYPIPSIYKANPSYQDPKTYTGDKMQRDIYDRQVLSDYGEMDAKGLLSEYAPHIDEGYIHAKTKEGEEEGKNAEARRDRAKKRKAKANKTS